MSKAFLSHSSKQKPLVELIANKLGRDNCIVDKYNFEIGCETLEQIISSIGKSDLFVLFLSSDALNSEWVKYEIQLAHTINQGLNENRILILQVDPEIDHTDQRIPEWLKTKFNIKSIIDPVILYKKIESKLRDLAIESHPYIKKKEEIFIGRNGLLEEFQKKYYNTNLTKPTSILVSGLEGVGRRKFIINALDGISKLNKFHSPITISLDSRDSIEDFIIRIEDLNSRSSLEVIGEIKNLSLEEKILYAKNLLLTFQNTNEILFILDKGCIVQPNKEVSGWYNEIVNAHEFNNNTLICIISRFRPKYNVDNNKIISFYVGELPPLDRQILLVRYCDLLDIRPSQENLEQILSILNGMPGQVFHVAQLIKDRGSDKVVSTLDEIKKHDDTTVYEIIELIRNKGKNHFEILVLISRFEFISYNLIYRVFGKSDEINEVLDDLYVYGIYDRIGFDREYIKVHHAISDYIMRAKYAISPTIKSKLKTEIKFILSDANKYPDVSEILVTINSIIEAGGKIPDNLFIPSVALRTIVELYYQNNYEQANLLADQFLDNYRKYDPHIIREIRYWHSLSYARRQSDKFFDQIKHFDGLDHNFLLGFYRRLEKKFEDAERLFKEAIKYDKHSKKSSRELVNVLLTQKKYSEALELAEKNYYNNKLNAFHIQGYFICLTRKAFLTVEEKQITKELLEDIQKSHDAKASDIHKTMLGEYEYYVNGNFDKAIELLKEAAEGNKYYGYKALIELYSKRGLHDRVQHFNKQVKVTSESLLD